MIKFKENLEETRRDSEQGFKVNKRVADANLITIWKKITKEDICAMEKAFDKVDKNEIL